MNDVRNLLGRLQVQDFEYREFDVAPPQRQREPVASWAPPATAPEGLLAPAGDPRKSSMADVFAVIASTAEAQARLAP